MSLYEPCVISVCLLLEMSTHQLPGRSKNELPGINIYALILYGDIIALLALGFGLGPSIDNHSRKVKNLPLCHTYRQFIPFVGELLT